MDPLDRLTYVSDRERLQRSNARYYHSMLQGIVKASQGVDSRYLKCQAKLMGGTLRSKSVMSAKRQEKEP